MTGLIAADVVLPVGALIALVILEIIEIALLVYCIVDIARRPAVAIMPKWAWIVVIVLFNLIGSIVYLVAGRAPAPAPEPRSEPEGVAGDRAQAAVDLLYGPGARPEASGGTPPPPPPAERS